MLSQRLLRRLCTKCKIAYTPNTEELLAVEYPWKEGEEVPSLFQSKKGGCKECASTGYRGRLGVHEVLLMDESIRTAITRGASADEVNRIARSSGMVTMKEDSWYKVSQGITDIKEVLRTVT